MEMHLDHRFVVDAPIDRVWKIMALDFAEIGSWASAITLSRPDTSAPVPDGAPVGARVCTAPGFGDVHETFVHFDEAARTFTYRAEASGMPPFVTGLQNRWSFRALELDRTEIVTRGTVTMRDLPGRLVAPFLRLRLRGTAALFAAELKHLAETGEAAPSKLRAQARAAEPSTA
jgi:hypothetical protein